MKEKTICRGDLFYYDFGTRTGSVQSGTRPVLVIQADDYNRNAPTIIVAAVTGVIKKRYLPSHKPILTIREASFYTGISEKKLIEITNLYACPFVLWMGNRRFIKRKAFEKFIQTSEFKGGADDEQIE